MSTISIKLVCVGLPAAGQAVSDHEKCSLLQALQTNGVQVSVSLICTKCTVLWIRIGFNADPDPAFFLSQCGSRSGSREYNQWWFLRIQIRILVTKSLIFIWKIPILNRSKNINTKAFLKDRKQGFCIISVNCHAPGLGSGSQTAKWMRIRIHDTANAEHSFLFCCLELSKNWYWTPRTLRVAGWTLITLQTRLGSFFVSVKC